MFTASCSQDPKGDRSYNPVEVYELEKVHGGLVFEVVESPELFLEKPVPMGKVVVRSVEGKAGMIDQIYASLVIPFRDIPVGTRVKLTRIVYFHNGMSQVTLSVVSEVVE